MALDLYEYVEIVLNNLHEQCEKNQINHPYHKRKLSMRIWCQLNAPTDFQKQLRHLKTSSLQKLIFRGFPKAFQQGCQLAAGYEGQQWRGTSCSGSAQYCRVERWLSQTFLFRGYAAIRSTTGAWSAPAGALPTSRGRGQPRLVHCPLAVGVVSPSWFTTH